CSMSIVLTHPLLISSLQNVVVCLSEIFLAGSAFKMQTEYSVFADQISQSLSSLQRRKMARWGIFPVFVLHSRRAHTCHGSPSKNFTGDSLHSSASMPISSTSQRI
ncbi:hypothetical protein PFISCL1PPCAC_20929, partial [Pristionchus fissidentatus]